MSYLTDYKMGYQQPVPNPPLEDFVAGKLDTWSIVVLMQDVIEAGLIPYLPWEFQRVAQHCVTNGLCHCYGRALQ